MNNDNINKHSDTPKTWLMILRRVFTHGALAGVMLGLLSACTDPSAVMDDYICQCRPSTGGDVAGDYLPPVPIKGPVGTCPHHNDCNNIGCLNKCQ